LSAVIILFAGLVSKDKHIYFSSIVFR